MIRTLKKEYQEADPIGGDNKGDVSKQWINDYCDKLEEACAAEEELLNSNEDQEEVEEVEEVVDNQQI